MTNNCNGFMGSYVKYLSESFTVEETSIGCRVYTPFIGYDGDPISFYIKDIGSGEFILRDMGEALTYLDMFGVDVVRGGNKEIFNNILSLYEVGEANKEIRVKTSKKTLNRDINSFIMALQAIMNLGFRKKPAKPLDFHKRAHQYCEANNIDHKYQREIKAKGKHIIDLTSLNEKVLVQALGTTLETPNQIKRYSQFKLFPFLELKILKRSEYKVSLYDDEVRWDNDSMIFMENYSDDALKYSDRKKLSEILA